MNSFNYLVDQFADVRIMRYRITDWDSLTLQQKAYVYCLGEAAKCGRDILFDQNFKYNLLIRKTLEAILNSYEGNREGDDFRRFTEYAKRVFFSNGIHHHYAEDKFFLEVTEDYFRQLILHSPQIDTLIAKQDCASNLVSAESLADFLIPIIFDRNRYAMRRSGEEDIILNSSVNFYDGALTKPEVEAFYQKKHVPGDKTPISYGLNSKLVKDDNGIREEVYRVDGLYGKAIDKIISWLEKANEVAENDRQRTYTQKLIEYYKTGDLKTWDEYNILWVQDTASHIDFVNGFIEDYNDPMGMKATWESIVDYKDGEATKRSNIISENAQWFEDHSPVDARFKKEHCKGVSAKSIVVTTLGGDCFPSPPIGINLPNADWIRKDYGSKSVTITNLMEAYDKAADECPKSVRGEFCWSEEEVELGKRYGSETDVIHTNLHECLGHGSGKLLPGTPPGALKEYSSTLEEARADLFGLYYLADPKLVELGIISDAEAYKAEYCGYIRNGLMTQLARVELGRDVTEAHMQNRKLIAEWCLEQGRGRAAGGADVIERRTRDGKTFFVVNDFVALRQLFGALLAEVQRIKSEGDYAAGKALVDRYGVKVDLELHREVKERYDALGLKPYGGFINPVISPVVDNGQVVDYRVDYPDDFLAEHLELGERYSFL
ncbi:MAG: dipeptidyl peptidase 3 [Bacteroidales bacterium]|nr:dipeptidyl peptidase 3 [Bacteroidales bacterium]